MKMYNWGKIAALVLANAISLNQFSASAQSDAEPATNVDWSSASDAQVILQAIELTTPLSADQAPAAGNFYSAQHSPISSSPWPPLPGNTLGLPVWSLGTNMWLVDDTSVDYSAIVTSGPMMAMAMDGVLPPGSNGTNIYSPSGNIAPFDPGTNLWIAQEIVSNGSFDGILSNTFADVEYQLLSANSLDSTQWVSQGFVLGSELTNWTPWSVPFNATTNFFLNALSWQDSGTGIPDWWWLKYFGQDTNVDEYGNPEGDGWNNLQKFQNGMNPNLYYTPPPPENLTVTYNANNNTAQLNWQPPSGPTVSSYTIQRNSGYGDVQNYTVSSATFTDTSTPNYVPDDLFNYGPSVLATYQVQANYSGGATSMWSSAVSLEPSPSASSSSVPMYGSFVSGPQGSAYFVAPNIPAGVSALRITRIDQIGLANGFWNLGLPYITNVDIPVGTATNGMFLIPSQYAIGTTNAYDFVYYDWWAQFVYTNGDLSIAGNNFGYEGYSVGTTYFYNNYEWIAKPYFDGRQALKQNLIFLLRAGMINSPFAFADEDTRFAYNVVTIYANSPTYAYSSLFSPMQPFEDNYRYRNFVFSMADLGPWYSSSYPVGHITNGVSGSFDNYFNDPSDYPMPLILSEPPKYQFQFPGPGGSVSPVLGTNDTQWLCSYPLDSTQGSFDDSMNFVSSGYLEQIGITPSVTDFNVYQTMSSNARNIYGLPFLSALIAYDSGDAFHDVHTNILSAGSSVENVGSGDTDLSALYFYPQTAQPDLETVEYDFWGNQPTNSLPGGSQFSPTNSIPPMIVGVGYPYDSYQPEWRAVGFAKMRLANGYSGVYSYLGQYFDTAYTVDTNGNTTTNVTGLLSSYGDFFATQPGQAALVTMPDIDTGERGTGIVNCVSLQVDKNHDGIMDTSFNGLDYTSESSPMEFWVNNGCDVPGVNGGYDQDLEPALNTTNYISGRITCQRDLENFARLWIRGLPAALSNGDYYVTLSCTAISGSPAINLYYAETNGGIGYLTDTNISNGFIGQSAIATISPDNSYVLPFWLFNGSDRYFMFEGAGTGGEGRFDLTIYQGSNVIAQTSTFIDLHDVRDFFEHPRASDVSLADPPTTNVGDFTIDSYETAQDASEDNNIIIYVHGANNTPFVYEDSNASVFKRLYWEGYHGRYVAFRWPSPTWSFFPVNTNQVTVLGYNKTEYVGWQSGLGLKHYIDDLRNRFSNSTVNVLATSGGGVVACEAIRSGARVDNLALLLVSLPAEAFDGNNPNLIYPYLATGGANTPDVDALGGYNNCFTNATRIVNFYNDDDYALYKGPGGAWEFDQKYTRPDNSIPSTPGWYYYFDGTNCFFVDTDDNGLPVDSRMLTQDYEKKSYVARSRTKAIGAAGLEYAPYTLAGGVISTNISLQDPTLGFVNGAAFNDSRADHSGEFTKPIPTALPLYRVLLDTGFDIRPKL